MSAAVCLHIGLFCDVTLVSSLEYATSFRSVIQSLVSSWRNSFYSTISSIGQPRDQSDARLSVTRLEAGWSGVQIPTEARLLSYFPNVQTSYIYPSSYTSGTGGFPGRIKWPGHEIHCSPPSSAKVKNDWRYTSIPPTCLHGMYSNFTFF